MSVVDDIRRRRLPDRRPLGVDAVDLRAQRHELGLDLFVAAVHVLNSGDHRGFVGGQRGKHQRGPGPAGEP